MTPNERLVVAALADRLIYGNQATFHGEDAVELLRLIPTPSRGRRLLALLPGMKAQGKVPGQGFEGAAAGGHGPVRMQGADKAFEIDMRGVRVFRAGQWKLARVDGLLAGVRGHAHLEITQVMGEVEGERTAIVTFGRGVPKVMSRWVEVPLSLGPVTLTVSTQQPWKDPVFGMRGAADPHEIGFGSDHSGHACLAA